MTFFTMPNPVPTFGEMNTISITAISTLIAATPTGGENAVEAIEELREAGYHVQVNGGARTSWSGCLTTAVSAPTINDEPPGDFATAYVTVRCPDETP